MARNDLAQKLKKLIWQEVSDDMKRVGAPIAKFADSVVIAENFAKGFPGHTLTDKYLARKRREGRPEIVGQRTGKLLKAATNQNAWQLNQPNLARKHTVIARKKKHGLTAYSHFVRTKSGGMLDYFAVDQKTAMLVEAELARLLGDDYKVQN